MQYFLLKHTFQYIPGNTEMPLCDITNKKHRTEIFLFSKEFNKQNVNENPSAGI